MGDINLNTKLDDNMDDIYDEAVNNIRSLLQYKKRYKECIIQCRILYNKLRENDRPYYFWVCLYDTALCYRKLNFIDKSNIFCNRALFIEVSMGDRAKNYWLKADNFVSKGMFEKAMPYYRKCLDLYKAAVRPRLRISILFNIAKAKNSPKTLLKLIEIMKLDPNFTYKDLLQADVSKYNYLLIYYREFIENCIKNNDQTYIFRLLNSISDKNLKSEVRKIITELRCL